MTIDERYGYPTVPEAFVVSVGRFPEGPRERLMGALEEVKGVWRELEVTAFERGGTMYLRVTLDVGDRPLHLIVHEDGEVMQFDAPVLLGFPAAASHFVLSRLCGENVYLSFRVDAQQLGGAASEKEQGEQASRAEALIGWGRFEFGRFVEMSAAFLPYIVAKLTEAERELWAFQDEPSPVLKLVA